MNIGDRVVLQKDVKEIKSGSVCTIIRELDEKTFLVRFGEQFIGTSKGIIRKAGISEIKSVLTEHVVSNQLWCGTIYRVDIKTKMDTIKEGDIGFVMGVEVAENEEEDVFTVDFGIEKAKLTKKFIYDHMTLVEHVQDGFCEPETKHIYIEENNNKNEDVANDNYIDSDIKITAIRINQFDFDLHEKDKIKINTVIHKKELDIYIDALNKLKSFLKQ